MEQRTSGRVAAVLAATAAAWLVVGVAGALGTWLWWAIASVPLVALLFAPFALFKLSGRTWPTWLAFIPTFTLMLTAFAVPGDWYMRSQGTPVTATVASAACMETRNDRCLYAYTLVGPDGGELPGEFRDTVVYEQGSTMRVVTDPYGIFGPRLADDLDMRVFDIAALIAYVLFALITVLAAVLGERRPVTEATSSPAARSPSRGPSAGRRGSPRRRRAGGRAAARR